MNRLTAVLFGLLALASCASAGDASHPYVRQLTWFSYVNGDDLRATCAAGSAERYRIIYNARYTKQVRAFEIVAASGGGATVAERMTGQANILEIIPGLEQDWAWHGKIAQTELDPSAFAALKKTFADSGLYGPAPQGLRLYSDAYHWVAVSCRDGVVGFNAWQFPSEGFKALTFGKSLLDLKLIDRPIPEPAAPPHLTYKMQERHPYFHMEVGENGLAGSEPLFGAPGDFWKNR